MKKLVFYDVDMNRVGDGEYEGICETELVKVKAGVEIKEHKILKIDILEHGNGRGTGNITKAMVEDNTYNVDAISGATVSGEVIKSIVSHTLRRGEKQ